uniref:Uncharacterized protein n=1 Tax=Clastoptera arizonana TaxID=38151 RepID=A0A1B6D8T5_9HEMI
MFGTKLRSWMETHIVRSRKKQQRKEEKSKSGSSSAKLVGSSPPSHVKSNSFEKKYEKPYSKSPKHVKEVEGTTPVTHFNDCKVAKTSMSLKQSDNPLNCTINSLSSPESAYSTGYSTDGTSPGASVPPEYYINLRTGTHYFHTNQVNSSVNNQSLQGDEKEDKTTGLSTTSKVGSANTSQTPLPVLSPRPPRHKSKQSDGFLPESSTEEDLVGENNLKALQNFQISKAQNKNLQPMQNLHRRTESYDESSQHRSSGMFSPSYQERDSGDSSSALTNVSYQCTSPYLPGASPRQRNRIRTNPWLGTQPVNANNLPLLGTVKNYNSQGETSSTVGSSSTISSSGCKQVNDEYLKKTFSPRGKERKRITREDIKDFKNANVQQNPLIVLNGSPQKKNPINTITTCSPCPSHPCRHSLRTRLPIPSSSSSSAPSSASEDEHHGNTSDFSDDDVTLNEMLGKFDESYVYEKETDILSDSDPTDCEEQVDYGKVKNTGHCTYYRSPGLTPDMSRKSGPRTRESLIRRQRGEGSSNRSSRSRIRSRSKNSEGSTPDLFQQNTNRKYSSRRKLHNVKKQSCENVSKNENNQVLEINGKLVKPYENLEKPFETSGKYLNLNRVLMERLINNQRNGTRSADGTPVSLRKNINPSDYNGKYIRNHHVSKLINANIGDRRSSLEERKLNAILDTKKRSNSLTGNRPIVSSAAIVGLNDIDREGDIKYRKLIQEAEHIIEDFQIKSKTDCSSPVMHSKSATDCYAPISISVPQSPLALKYRDPNNTNVQLHHQHIYANVDKKCLLSPKHPNAHEEGIFKTISKTLEKIVKNSSDINRKLDKSVDDPFAKGKNKMYIPSSPALLTNKRLLKNIEKEHSAMLSNGLITTPVHIRGSNNLMVPRLSVPNNNTNISFQSSDRNRTGSFDNGFDTNIFITSLGNRNSGFDVTENLDNIDALKYSTNANIPTHLPGVQNIPWHHRSSQSERFKQLVNNSVSPKKHNDPSETHLTKHKSSLLTFRSFDFGNEHVLGTRYCPRSEPVKRKIYTCSASFGKLQKSLLRKQPGGITNSSINENCQTNRNMLKSKVAQLRKERMHIESKVQETQDHIDRIKLNSETTEI